MMFVNYFVPGCLTLEANLDVCAEGCILVKVKVMSARKTSLKRNSSGFTMIELLVVVVIIGVLTSIAIASFNSFSRAQSIRLAALELKNDLRKVKTDSISGKKDSQCRSDQYKRDGTGPLTPPADKVDDYSLTGHYVTFVVDMDRTLPPPYTYTKGQQCAATVGTPGASYILPPNSVLTKNISGKTHVMQLEVFKQGVAAACLSKSTVGDQLTVEFFSINSNPFNTDPYSADVVSFYNGAMSPTPPASEWKPCTSGTAKADRMEVTLANPETYNANICYKISIENNGSIYENKISCP